MDVDQLHLPERVAFVQGGDDSALLFIRLRSANDGYFPFNDEVHAVVALSLLKNRSVWSKGLLLQKTLDQQEVLVTKSSEHTVFAEKFIL